MNNQLFKDEFSGKVVVVTGGNGQIGSEIIKSYLATGAVVVNFDLSNPNSMDWQSLSS